MWSRILAFIALLGALLFAFSEYKVARLRAVGDYFAKQTIAGTVSSLADSRAVPDVVRVGSSLPGVLAGIRPNLLTGYTIEVRRGDISPSENDSSVSHCILLRARGNGICLRMRYDLMLNRFHIVGYCGAP